MVNDELLDMLFEIGEEDVTVPFDRTECIRAPFPYSGSKFKSLEHIIPRLPITQHSTWVDHFGGTGVVSWNVPTCHVMVYNDRYSAVVAFYRCLRDPVKKKALFEYLSLMPPHSREEFYWARDTWVNDEDDVVRAAKWYYGLTVSVLGRQQAFARAITSHHQTNVWDYMDKLPMIHDKLGFFTLENLDVFQCINDYDSPSTVHYFDPPYVGTDQGGYESKWTSKDQERLLNRIAELQGFVALSHYPCKEIEKRSYWTNRYQWDHEGSASGKGRDAVIECLWVKETKQ